MGKMKQAAGGENAQNPVKRNAFRGLTPIQIARKVHWRFAPTKFTSSFRNLSLYYEDNADARKPYLEKVDKWIAKGKKKKAHWWLSEAHKRARDHSPVRSAPIAVRKAEIEGHVFSHLKPELSRLMLTLAYASLDMQKQFSKHLDEHVGNDVNKYGEAKKKLDVWANDVFCQILLETGLVRKIYSEELDAPLAGNPNAPFIVTMDPVDGSSNIKSKNPFGSIFGIYEKDPPQSGRDIVASAYALYGPVYSFVYSAGNGATEIGKSYNPEDGSIIFKLRHQKLELPGSPKVYGFGGHPLTWDANFQKFVFKDVHGHFKLKLRYSGAFVADFAQVLFNGGIFAYPRTLKAPEIDPSNPLVYKPQEWGEGKLRLTYECIPMAFLMEQAGGTSWDGKSYYSKANSLHILDGENESERGAPASVLDLRINDMDAIIPLYIGNSSLIGALEQRFRFG